MCVHEHDTTQNIYHINPLYYFLFRIYYNIFQQLAQKFVRSFDLILARFLYFSLYL